MRIRLKPAQPILTAVAVAVMAWLGSLPRWRRTIRTI